MDPSEHRPSSRHHGLEAELEEIIRDLGKKLAGQHDLLTIEEAVVSIAEQFRDARITSFLPILIKKQVFENLRTRDFQVAVAPLEDED